MRKISYNDIKALPNLLAGDMEKRAAGNEILEALKFVSTEEEYDYFYQVYVNGYSIKETAKKRMTKAKVVEAVLTSVLSKIRSGVEIDG